jgi:hypothetical protein
MHNRFIIPNFSRSAPPRLFLTSRLRPILIVIFCYPTAFQMILSRCYTNKKRTYVPHVGLVIQSIGLHLKLGNVSLKCVALLLELLDLGV